MRRLLANETVTRNKIFLRILFTIKGKDTSQAKTIFKLLC